ncbi:MAG: peptidase M3 [Bacteroidetes bacterium HGW-Bacteroidetes-6]|jgi:peptidyl-dipeptidase A|nr:MAG: peptidase M3 [Bacteroidetes bacterium HGW-Bacteroidetes-6]
MKNKKNIFLMTLLSAILVTGITSCGGKKEGGDMKTDLQTFIKKFEDTIRPLTKEYSLAAWNAEISGKEEDYNKVEELGIKYTKVFTNKEDFEFLKKVKDAGGVKDSLLDRELDVLFNAYQSNQVDEKLLNDIIGMETAISQKFNTYRVVVEGDSLTDNEVETTLVESTDSKLLENVWCGSKKIGENVSADIIALVKKRNEVAKSLGFNNYHEMSLKLSEQDPAEIEDLFNELDDLTRDSYAQLKGEIDSFLSARFKIPVTELKPWHYQNRFFQEAPKIYSLNLDKYYKGKDLVKLTVDYYASLGMDITDIVKNSDLFEKEGKNQHAFCTDIDNEGDVRVLCNVTDNSKWMNTMLHEFGHAVYDKYISRDLPFVLREPAHTFTTEAIAMIFGRMASNAQWMQDMLGISDEEKAKIKDEAYKYTRLEQLVFSRWSQVMYRFEKGLYENPDQDLNKLWWDLVEKYQLVKKPEGRNNPDWASKIHIATSPCYYHNYHLGELLASQLNHYIVTKIMKQEDVNGASYFNNKEVGKYLIDKVLSVGSKYNWNQMIEMATGEKLTAKYYAEQFVNGK